jgi:hypothetical protein
MPYSSLAAGLADPDEITFILKICNLETGFFLRYGGARDGAGAPESGRDTR